MKDSDSGTLRGRSPWADRGRLALAYYWLVALLMLLLLYVELRTAGEVSLQAPMLLMMLLPVTGPAVLLLFVVPTVLATLHANRRPVDPLLCLWSWLHIAFWLFLLDNIVYLVDALVVHRDTIRWLWGGYALIGVALPLMYRLVRSPRLRVVVLAVLVAGVLGAAAWWDPRQGAFDLPQRADEGSTALLAAAEAGDVHSVRRLLADGANPAQRDALGWDALHLAVYGGHAGVVDALLAAGADPNTRGYRGPRQKAIGRSGRCGWVLDEAQSVLVTAIRLGDADMIRRLLAAGAVEDPARSLAVAAAQGDLDRLRELLSADEAGRGQPSLRRRIGEACLVAASRADADALAVLPGCVDDPGSLWNAAAFARPVNVEWLLGHGAAANANHSIHGPPLMAGFARRAERTPDEVRRTIGLLAAAGADVDHVDPFSCADPPDVSVLINTVRAGDATAVAALLEQGADRGWRDSTGRSARDYAAVLGRADLVLLFD